MEEGARGGARRFGGAMGMDRGWHEEDEKDGILGKGFTKLLPADLGVTGFRYGGFLGQSVRKGVVSNRDMS